MSITCFGIINGVLCCVYVIATGVTSYQVDLETKMVVIIGDIIPFEVLESVSKVKNAELWTITTQENTKII